MLTIDDAVISKEIVLHKVAQKMWTLVVLMVINTLF